MNSLKRPSLRFPKPYGCPMGRAERSELADTGFIHRPGSWPIFPDEKQKNVGAAAIPRRHTAALYSRAQPSASRYSNCQFEPARGDRLVRAPPLVSAPPRLHVSGTISDRPLVALSTAHPSVRHTSTHRPFRRSLPAQSTTLASRTTVTISARFIENYRYRLTPVNSVGNPESCKL